VTSALLLSPPNFFALGVVTLREVR
jgi:hypothetical protein